MMFAWFKLGDGTRCRERREISRIDESGSRPCDLKLLSRSRRPRTARASGFHALLVCTKDHRQNQLDCSIDGRH